jgi:hypothetical protein
MHHFDMSMEYSPLWGGIVDSSSWGLPDHVCKLWVTLLAIRDWDGNVKRSIYGLWRACQTLSKEQIEEGLSILSSPDPDTYSQEKQGRRIEVVEGGWHVVNHEKYLELARQANKRAKWRREKAAQRARLALLKQGVVNPYKTAEERLEERQEAAVSVEPGAVVMDPAVCAEYSLGEKLKGGV